MTKAEMVGSYKGVPLTAKPLEEVLTVVEEELRACGAIMAAESVGACLINKVFLHFLANFLNTTFRRMSLSLVVFFSSWAPIHFPSSWTQSILISLACAGLGSKRMIDKSLWLPA